MPTQFCPECCNAHYAAATAFIDSILWSGAAAGLTSCVSALLTLSSALESAERSPLYCLRKCVGNSIAAALSLAMLCCTSCQAVQVLITCRKL
jgi:hypothetical protein